MGWWPQAEAGTEQRRAKENDVIWTPGGREAAELAAEHLGTPDETQCSGFPGSPRGAPGGGEKEQKDEAAFTAEAARKGLRRDLEKALWHGCPWAQPQGNKRGSHKGIIGK